MVGEFVRFLNDRKLLIIGTHEWNLYQIDLLAFCQALAQHGVDAQVLFDRTLAEMEADIQRGNRWQIDEVGLDYALAEWSPSLMSHIKQHQLEPFVLDDWPEKVGDTVIFRFGYVENFSTEHRAFFEGWQADGATFLNPFSSFLYYKKKLEPPACRKVLRSLL